MAFLTIGVMIFAQTPLGYAQGNLQGKRKLLVTAYYSPLPDQRFYIRGSYEADQRLNGRGTNGADGTEVFVGMLAAPKLYPFGTRVLVPGLGVGVVHDRGGAILTGEDYDRIDVWMGRGEEGLARAINWGARMVEGEIYSPGTDMQVTLDFTGVSPHLNETFISRLQSSLSASSAFTKSIEEIAPEEIQDLQVSLTLFGYYSGPIDGVLSEATREAIVLFQLQEGILSSRTEPGAGRFGPTTQGKLKEKVANFDVEREKEKHRIFSRRAALSAGFGKNASGPEVEALQQSLWELGYYQGPISHRYDPLTIDAVFAFQQDHGILSTAYETGAGYFGPRTHEVLIAALDQRLEALKQYPKAMQTWIPPKIELPKIASLTPFAEWKEPASLSFEIDFLDE